jgi:hypothetical protein
MRLYENNKWLKSTDDISDFFKEEACELLECGQDCLSQTHSKVKLC